MYFDLRWTLLIPLTLLMACEVEAEPEEAQPVESIWDSDTDADTPDETGQHETATPVDTGDAVDTGEPTLAPVVVSVQVLDSETHEGGLDTAQFQLILEAAQTEDLTIDWEWVGSAQFDIDYTLECAGLCTTESAIVPAGETTLDVTIVPVATHDLEASEWLQVQPLESTSNGVDPTADSAMFQFYEYGPSSGQVYYLAPDGSDDGTGEETDPFASLDYAQSVLSPGDTLYVMDGTYTASNYSDNYGSDGDSGISRGVLAKIEVSGTPDNWITIAAYPDGNEERPLFRFDGSGGIQLGSGVSYVRIEGLEVEGPNATISYDWAWSHRWSKENFYVGRGIFSWGPVHHILIRDCHVHHTPGSGIRFNSSDYIQIEDNIVANTTWWSSSAESAVVIATAVSVDEEDAIKFLYSGNWVYNNWNFLEFCDSGYEGSTEDAYGNCDAYTGGIIDGQGLYVTRNNDTYTHGRMRFENNIAFNNGFGGVVYHKTDRGELVNNLVFMNGAYPGISHYSGLSVNTVDDLVLHNNLVWARDDGDYAIKDNGNATNVIATHNTVIGISQFGEDSDNWFLEHKSVHLSEFFSDIQDISEANPDPLLSKGDVSPGGIDAYVRSLTGDFRPIEAAAYLRDQGTDELTPVDDIDGTLRPQGSAADVGPYEYIEP